MACSKKMKFEIRPFQPSWTTDFGFIFKNDRTMCALCLETVVTRTSSVKRHYETKHKESFKCDADKNESIKNAVARYEKQTNVFVNMIGRKNQATEASYKIAQCIANFGKPFTDGDYNKEIFLKCSEVLFDDLPNKNIIISRIKEMPTSARTVERRITEMGQNIKEQHTDALRNVNVLSVALDESVDINGIPRLAIVTRHCDTEMREELCCLESMHGNTTGKDILKTFIDHFDKRGIDIKKIFAATTDGAPAMVGRLNGFVNLLEEKIGHPILKFHCIIHQENICAKISKTDLNKVMATVSKIVNFLVARSSLTKRQFEALLEEMESTYKHIPLHCNVRWLSCGKVLERFVGCFDSIKVFLEEKSERYPELEDTQWLTKLMFLTDLTAHLNELNLRLQGVGQTVMELYEVWKAFVAKIDIFIEDIKTRNLRYFKHLNNFIINCKDPDVTLDVTAEYMDALKLEFFNRFKDFNSFGPMFSFLIKPDSIENFDLQVFEWMGIEEFEMQLIDFKVSALWVNKFAELRKNLENSTTSYEQSNSILICWSSLPEKFDCLKKVAFAMLSAFGSTYICEQIFSHMKFIINPYRSRLTTDHSEACVQIKVSKYIPDISKLSKAKQGQGSH